MFIQDNWDPDWQSTSSSKVTYLLQKLNTLLEGNREIGYYMGEGKKCMGELLSPSHISDTKLLLLDNFSRTSTNTEKLSPEKVIIFSQFLEHIHVIEQQVVVVYHRLGTLCVVPFIQLMVDESHFCGPVNYCRY